MAATRGADVGRRPRRRGRAARRGRDPRPLAASAGAGRAVGLEVGRGAGAWTGAGTGAGDRREVGVERGPRRRARRRAGLVGAGGGGRRRRDRRGPGRGHRRRRRRAAPPQRDRDHRAGDQRERRDPDRAIPARARGRRRTGAARRPRHRGLLGRRHRRALDADLDLGADLTIARRPVPRAAHRDRCRRRSLAVPRRAGHGRGGHRRAAQHAAHVPGQLARADRQALAPHQRLEIALQLARRLVASLAVAAQRAGDDLVERRRAARPHPRHRRGVVGHDALQRRQLVVVAAEQAPARHQLVEQDPDREHVAAAIEGLAPALLRRHVGDLALQRAGAGAVIRLLHLGHAEVGDLDRAVERHQDVGQRHVTMHDREGAALAVGEVVGVVEPGADPEDDPDRHAQRHRVAGPGRRLEQVPQIPAAHVLHRVVVVPGLLADVVDRDDVGVVEARGQARLVEEHAHVVGLHREVRQHPLDHHLLLEAGDALAARQVDLGHAPHRQEPHDLVATEASPGRQEPGVTSLLHDVDHVHRVRFSPIDATRSRSASLVRRRTRGDRVRCGGALSPRAPRSHAGSRSRAPRDRLERRALLTPVR